MSECSCNVFEGSPGIYYVKHCPLHRAAPAMQARIAELEAREAAQLKAIKMMLSLLHEAAPISDVEARYKALGIARAALEDSDG